MVTPVLNWLPYARTGDVVLSPLLSGFEDRFNLLDQFH
jgi:hypothetical protein